mmetsp:Transcript_1910/g.2352  ORF Transcript_1910/g.2352 Transcript_1910/m.2352 type:complete len:90 (+) Transcript_1910:633-902(+)
MTNSNKNLKSIGTRYSAQILAIANSGKCGHPIRDNLGDQVLRSQMKGLRNMSEMVTRKSHFEEKLVTVSKTIALKYILDVTWNHIVVLW